MLDIIKKQDAILGSVLKSCLHTPFWESYPVRVTYTHNWQKVPFDAISKNTIPESSGVYAFFIQPDIAGFPEHSYLVYIGKAGDNNDNNLRNRFMQYIYGLKYIKRTKLNRVLNKWKEYLVFYYSEVNDGTNISNLEDDLLDTFIPYCNTRFSARIKDIIKVLQ